GGAVARPDMLEHADGRDLVEGAGELAVILQLDRDPVLEPKPPYLLLRKIVLRLRQRHAMRGDAVMLRGVADEPAPAAADIEEALARLQPQLAADHVELGRLRLGER